MTSHNQILHFLIFHYTLLAMQALFQSRTEKMSIPHIFIILYLTKGCSHPTLKLDELLLGIARITGCCGWQNISGICVTVGGGSGAVGSTSIGFLILRYSFLFLYIVLKTFLHVLLLRQLFLYMVDLSTKQTKLINPK